MNSSALRRFHRLAVGLVAVGLGLLATGCAADRAYSPPNPRTVEAFTGGEISRWSPVRIVFAEPVGAEAGTVARQGTVTLAPRTPGEATWTDPWTLEFVPAEPLRAGERYEATFQPDATLASDPGHAALEPFRFSFLVVPRGIDVDPQGFSIVDPGNPDLMEFRATVAFSDVTEPNAAVDAFSVTHAGAKVDFTLDGARPARRFTLRVPNLRRRDEPGELVVRWDGGRDERARGALSFRVPEQERFQVLGVRPVTDREQYVEITFSEPLDERQNLAGLVRATGLHDLQPSARSNRVRLYSANGWPKTATLVIDGGVTSTEGRSLEDPWTATVMFPSEKPRVRFVGEGVVVPTSQGTTVPIETMNLNTIMVEAIQVYGSNIHQFLQVNRLDGGYELHRVGEVVWRKVIDLGWDNEDTDRWVRHGLDLSPLLERDPTGLYRLRITFRRPHIQYPCDADASSEPAGADASLDEWESGPQDAGEPGNWDFWGEFPDWRYREYRTDPCHPAYYMAWSDHNVSVSRNVMISDLGVLAQAGEDDRLTVAVNDLRTTRPVVGASLRLYNYQRRELASVRTDSRGMAVVELDRDVPFFLLADHGGQYGYLRLDPAGTLVTSHFDTGGAPVESGIQGFIYGERGVWRPGDDIYLSFILHDPLDNLPDSHPVRFEIDDPRGRTVDSRVFPSGTNDVYSLVTGTTPEAPTGTYTARVSVGNRTFTRPLRVETVVPNRLRIDLDFQGRPDALEDGPVRGTLEAMWLHGAPAPNLRADVRARFTPVATGFADYPDYAFDDPAREFSADEQLVFDGRLDQDGRAEFTTTLDVDRAPGRLRADLTTRVFEQTGAFSTEYRSIAYDPYDRYVGIRTPRGDAARGMLLTDEDHTVDLVLVDQEGSPVRSARLVAEVFKVGWRWWWETDRENLAAYVSDGSLEPIASGEVAIRDGRGSWSFRIDYPDWGRYLVRVTDEVGGHSAGRVVYVDWPGWAGRARDEGPGSAAMLVLQPEKLTYAVGEEVTVQLPVGTGGRGLVTVESRGRVIRSDWIHGRGPQTRYTFTATEAMAPNVYVHVTYLQPHLQTANDLPIRTYGIVSVGVEDPDTRLDPVIATGEVYRPGETVSISVSEASGRGMTYTLAVVDEGLLGLTRFSAPDPWDHFYQRLASGLRSWDLYDFVAGAYTGRLDTLLAIGGGGEGEDAGRRDVNRFEPVVRFVPPSVLRPGETNTHEVDIPRYIGSVRIMVVAADASAFGAAELAVPVRQEVMVLGTLPRILGVNEEIVAPVTVFALDPRAESVRVQVETEGPLRVEGASGTYLRFAEPGEQVARFRLTTDDQAGPAIVRFIATGAGTTAVEETRIDVRVPGTPASEVLAARLGPGERATLDVRLDGVAGTNRATLEVSQIPPLDLSRRLQYLIAYPHGCIEQTTSAVFPQLYLDRLADLTAGELERTEENITRGIGRIALHQTPSGGFAYWPGETTAHEWSTTYAGHFLLEADRRGYAIPAGTLAAWVDYQSELANAWYGSDFDSLLNQAYRLYTLALAREPAYAAMNRLRETADLPEVARWRLAGAYALAGNTSAARELVRGASIDAVAYPEPGETYGSEIRDRAMILETLVELGDSRASVLANDVSDALASDEGMSTQTSAYALLAMARYAFAAGPAERVDVDWSWNGAAARRIVSDATVVTQEMPVERAGVATLTLENRSDGTLFPRLIVEGVPRPGRERTVASGLRLDVSYYADGRPADVERMPAGEDLEIRVGVTNTSRIRGYEELVLGHLVPAGWEIVNERLSGLAASDRFDYRDIRDDRVYTYFDLPPGRTTTFTMRVTTAYEGRYYLPAVSCEAMYDPAITAVVPGRWVEVVPRR